MMIIRVIVAMMMISTVLLYAIFSQQIEILLKKIGVGVIFERLYSLIIDSEVVSMSFLRMMFTNWGWRLSLIYFL